MTIKINNDKRTYSLSNSDKQTIENALAILRLLRNHYIADYNRDITYYDYSVTFDLLKKILENEETNF
jgi:hypothetical protein